MKQLFRSLPVLTTDRVMMKLLEPHRASLMVRFRVENRKHLQAWEPRRPAGFFTTPFWEHHLSYLIQDYRDGHSLCLAIMDPLDTEVIGVCNFTNIIRGTFLACHLGYALAEKHQGQGLMFEALECAIRHVFSEIKLNRVMAAYIPRNARSGRLLHRLQFVKEGEAEKYLVINGRWEDHILTSRLNPVEPPA